VISTTPGFDVDAAVALKANRGGGSGRAEVRKSRRAVKKRTVSSGPLFLTPYRPQSSDKKHKYG
jgi:hypothetical protein